MISRTMSNRMKAAAIAALMCLSAAAAVVPAMSESMMDVQAVSLNQSMVADDVVREVTCDIGTNLDAITLTLTADYTGNFSYGFGINTAADPWWMEWDGSGWVDTEGGTVNVPGIDVAVTEGQTFTIVIDTSSLDLKYDPAGAEWGAGEYEFRAYYTGEGGSVKLVSATAGDQGIDNPTTPTTPTDPDEPVGPGANTDGSTSSNQKSGTWSFEDLGDGTGRMTATQARQVDGLGFLLTAGYDEEYYAELEEGYQEGDPINSYKFSYSNDFGLEAALIGPKGDADVTDETRDNIAIESLKATITSDGTPVKRFMYGGGLSVMNESPADTESAKRLAEMEGKETAGYWYNDMGEEVLEECEAAGVEFGIEPGMGYDLTAADGAQLGEYFNVVWDVPEGVYPYAIGPEISFQYWYGEVDAEEYTACEAVTIEEAVLTYTERRTFDYTATATQNVGSAIAAGEMSEGVAFADMGLGANSSVKAVVFTLDVASDLDKLVYGIGASVGEDWKMWADSEGGDGWNFVLTDVSAGTVEVAWIVPSGVDINEEYGNLQFGYWYGGKEGKELDEITLESVDVYYYEKEEETTTEPPTTEPPTTEPTTTEPAEVVASLYGDTNCDGIVNIADVILLNRGLLGDANITEEGQANADVDENDTLEATDSLNILKYIVELIDKLPV